MQPSSLVLSPNIFLFQRIETQWQSYALYKNCCYYYYYYKGHKGHKGHWVSKETYHFFRATLAKIHRSKIYYVWIELFKLSYSLWITYSQGCSCQKGQNVTKSQKIIVCSLFSSAVSEAGSSETETQTFQDRYRYITARETRQGPKPKLTFNTISVGADLHASTNRSEFTGPKR